jgi:hypothetical protein
MQQWPAVWIVFKTTEGLYIGSGDIGFPYISAVKSYRYDDPFWKRILISTVPYNGSKWAGSSFVPFLQSDISGLVGTNIYNTLTAKIYDSITIDITGLSAPAQALCFMRTINRNSLVEFIRNDQSFKRSPSQYCSAMADVCFDEDLAIVNAGFTSAANTICDRASASTTGETDDNYYNSVNAATLRDACLTSYAKVKCANPENRYIEAYGGSVSCVDMCNTALPNTDLYNACKTGSLSYCRQSNNIISNQCRSDITKYTELDQMLQEWCLNNSTNPNAPQYCPDLQFTTIATPASTSSASEPQNVQSMMNTATVAPLADTVVSLPSSPQSSVDITPVVVSNDSSNIEMATIPSVSQPTTITTTGSNVFEIQSSPLHELQTPIITTPTPPTQPTTNAAVVFQVDHSALSEVVTPSNIQAPTLTTQTTQSSSTQLTAEEQAIIANISTKTSQSTTTPIAPVASVVQTTHTQYHQSDNTMIWFILIIIAITLFAAVGSYALAKLFFTPKKTINPLRLAQRWR